MPRQVKLTVEVCALINHFASHTCIDPMKGNATGKEPVCTLHARNFFVDKYHGHAIAVGYTYETALVMARRLLVTEHVC